jgi:hypothetical protein
MGEDGGVFGDAALEEVVAEEHAEWVVPKPIPSGEDGMG